MKKGSYGKSILRSQFPFPSLVRLPLHLKGNSTQTHIRANVMGHVYDPKKSLEENKKDALKDAGPPSITFERKRAHRHLAETLKSFIKGKESFTFTQLAESIRSALDKGKLQEATVEKVLEGLKRDVHDNLHSTEEAEAELKRLRKLEDTLKER